MLGPDLVMKIFLFIYLFFDSFFLILHTMGYFNMNQTHIIKQIHMHAALNDFNKYTCIEQQCHYVNTSPFFFFER